VIGALLLAAAITLAPSASATRSLSSTYSGAVSIRLKPGWHSLGWVSVDIAAGNGHAGELGTLQAKVVKLALKPFTEGGPPTSVYVTYELRAVGETAPVFPVPTRIAVAAPARYVGGCFSKWKGLCIVTMSSAVPSDAHAIGHSCDTLAFPRSVQFTDGSCLVRIGLVSSPMRRGVKLSDITMVWQPWDTSKYPTRALTGH
jgi:hypothetical protein